MRLKEDGSSTDGKGGSSCLAATALLFHLQVRKSWALVDSCHPGGDTVKSGKSITQERPWCHLMEDASTLFSLPSNI